MYTVWNLHNGNAYPHYTVDCIADVAYLWDELLEAGGEPSVTVN